ncbi:class I SAM-dependent methyltransferase [Candidatus Kuenenbacteria bacterium]|nr:class I SAM-dependent methyltransferase [Candidatus Kuenenbacteria bacterium]
MWKNEYKKKDFYWGLKPDPALVKLLPKIKKGIVLDIGAGEGRNSIYFARKGFKVMAIDIVKAGLEKLENYAKEKRLDIVIKLADIRKFKFVPNKYSLVLAVATIDFLKGSEVRQIIEKIKKSLVSRGYIYLLVFSTKDPLYKKIKKLGAVEVEKNTFYLRKSKVFRHFFTQRELKKCSRNLILYF